MDEIDEEIVASYRTVVGRIPEYTTQLCELIDLTRKAVDTGRASLILEGLAAIEAQVKGFGTITQELLDGLAAIDKARAEDEAIEREYPWSDGPP